MFDVESAAFVQTSERLREALGQTSREFVTEQFRLWVGHIAKLTPPNSLAQGRKRVKQDIQKVFRPFDTTNTTDERVKLIVRQGNVAAFNIWASAVKVKFRAGPYDETVLKRARDRRGRVRSSGKKSVFVLGSKNTRALNAFIRRKQEHVGLARSGWSAALLRVGGEVPAWVSRHGAGMGAVEDGRGVPNAPVMAAINRTPWALRKDEGERIIRAATLARANAMRKALEVQLQLAARKAQFPLAG